jgi:hypothetical protein
VARNSDEKCIHNFSRDTRGEETTSETGVEGRIILK